MDLTFGLSHFGPEYAIIGLLITAVFYLYKKLVDAKDDLIKQAQDHNEKNERIRIELQRTSDNIFSYIQSHSLADRLDREDKRNNRPDNRDPEKRQ